MINPKEIAEWIHNSVQGCKFVGISNDGEVFLEYEDYSEELEIVVANKLKELFTEVKYVVSVVKPSLRQMEQVVEELNKVLNGPPKKNLLQIG